MHIFRLSLRRIVVIDVVIYLGLTHRFDYLMEESERERECTEFDRCFCVSFDITALRQAFEEHIVGQHIAVEVVLDAIEEHWEKVESGAATKPLVLSFHGLEGTGKTYMTELMADHLYRRGQYSPYVLRFDAAKEIPRDADYEEYRVINLLTNDIFYLHTYE